MRRSLLVVAAGLLALPLAARADFTGDPIQFTYYFPDLKSPYNTFGTTTAPFTVTLSDGSASFTVTGDQITVTSNVEQTLYSADFNGPVFTDLDKNTVITGITQDASLTTLFDATGTFTAHSVSINLQGLGLVSAGDTVTYDVSFAPSSVTPEPSTMMLLGTGLLGVGGVARRRLTH